jgi:hypothetical protein
MSGSRHGLMAKEVVRYFRMRPYVLLILDVFSCLSFVVSSLVISEFRMVASSSPELCFLFIPNV